jgi:hypothetical protein
MRKILRPRYGSVEAFTNSMSGENMSHIPLDLQLLDYRGLPNPEFKEFLLQLSATEGRAVLGFLRRKYHQRDQLVGARRKLSRRPYVGFGLNSAASLIRQAEEKEIQLRRIDKRIHNIDTKLAQFSCDGKVPIVKRKVKLPGFGIKSPSAVSTKPKNATVRAAGRTPPTLKRQRGSGSDRHGNGQ